MRHGEAGSHPIDSQRTLTVRGVEQVQHSANELANAGIQPSAIWTSPYVRARQTASVASETLGVSVLTHNALTPDSDPRALLAALQEHSGTSPLMVVSHMPFVENLTSLLIDGNRRARYPYDTAQIRVLELTWPASGCGLLKKELPMAG